MIQPKITFVTSKICPFARRVWLTLLEKQVPFQMRQVSLTNKQPYFTQVYHKAYGHDKSSDGKVPVLIHGDKIITQSDLVSWYIAQQFKNQGYELIPQQSFQKLKMRRFIQDYPSKLFGGFYSFMGWKNKSAEEIQILKKKLNDSLKLINNEIIGPYVLGQKMTLADIFIYPWLQRWVVLQKLVGLQIPKEFEKIHELKRMMQNRPLVGESLKETPPQYFIEGYKSYFG